MEAVNINKAERIGSVALGAAMAASSLGRLKKRPLLSLIKLVTGVYLIKRGASGHCVANEALGINTSDLSIGDAINTYITPTKYKKVNEERDSDQAY